VRRAFALFSGPRLRFALPPAGRPRERISRDYQVRPFLRFEKLNTIYYAKIAFDTLLLLTKIQIFTCFIRGFTAYLRAKSRENSIFGHIEARISLKYICSVHNKSGVEHG